MPLSGVEAEERACALLRAEGHHIVARNWHCRFGEIDVVTRDGDVLVFVEVKARSGEGFGGAAAAIDARKRRRLKVAALAFLQETGSDLPCRFDVVLFSPSGVEMIPDAFDTDPRCSLDS